MSEMDPPMKRKQTKSPEQSVIKPATPRPTKVPRAPEATACNGAQGAVNRPPTQRDGRTWWGGWEDSLWRLDNCSPQGSVYNPLYLHPALICRVHFEELSREVFKLFQHQTLANQNRYDGFFARPSWFPRVKPMSAVLSTLQSRPALCQFIT